MTAPFLDRGGGGLRETRVVWRPRGRSLDGLVGSTHVPELREALLGQILRKVGNKHSLPGRKGERSRKKRGKSD